jgi:hypothetical protein
MLKDFLGSRTISKINLILYKLPGFRYFILAIAMYQDSLWIQKSGYHQAVYLFTGGFGENSNPTHSSC